MRWRSRSACGAPGRHAPAAAPALQRSRYNLCWCVVVDLSSTSATVLRLVYTDYNVRPPRTAAAARRRRRAYRTKVRPKGVLATPTHTDTPLTKVPPNHTCILPLKSKLEGTAGMGSMHPGAPNADTVTVPSSWHLSLYEWLSFGKSTQPLATWWITGDFGLGFVQNASSKCSTIQFQVPSSFFSQWTRSLGQSGSCKHS